MSSENIQKKDGGPDRFVSNNQLFSVTLNELPMKVRESTLNFYFQQGSQSKLIILKARGVPQ